MFYNTPKFLSKPKWNNAFSYEKRQTYTNWVEKLYIPRLIETKDLTRLKVGEYIAIQEVDDGKLISAKWLENFIKISDKPVYIMDNHNHALFFWFKEFFEQDMDREFISVWHIDQHSDMKKTSTSLNLDNTWKEQTPKQVLSKVREYVNYEVNIGNYIYPAIQTGLVDSVTQIRSFDKLKGMQDYQSWDRVILNIDVDFWHPDMYGDDDTKIQLVKDLIPQAAIVTIATSPYFIKQSKAIDIVKKLLKDDVI